MSVWRMLLDLPTQLGHIGPAAGTAGIVQLLKVAQSFLALGVVLLARQLGCWDDVALEWRIEEKARERDVHPWW